MLRTEMTGSKGAQLLVLVAVFGSQILKRNQDIYDELYSAVFDGFFRAGVFRFCWVVDGICKNQAPKRLMMCFLINF